MKMRYRLSLFWWTGLLVGVCGIAYLIAISPQSSGLDQFQIEILGAFIGVFAALALAEQVKDIDEFRTGRKILLDLFDDMRNMKDFLKSTEPMHYPDMLWQSILQSGEAIYLEREVRYDLFAVWNLLRYQNDCRNEYSDALMSPRKQSKEFLDFLKKNALDARELLLTKVDGLIRKYNVKYK